MNEEQQREQEPTEQPCPMCGCADYDWLNCEVAGIETTAKICEECGYVYGGDL
jgi:hypothetical protein